MKEMRQDRIALDRASVRTFDTDGHMHVAQTNISKATVNPYRGREIPDSDALGLDPDRIYQLLRDPEELAKAASSFDGKPLVLAHKPTSAADHDHLNTVGSISNTTFDAPYLKAQLVVWTDEAIEAIRSEAQKELSCGYRYRADMTPGTFDGVKYDGVMRDIGGNHVALVKEGRAGPDVMVGDSMENLFMSTKKVALSRTGLLAQGALAVFLKPKLAADAKIDLPAILGAVTAKDFAARKPTIAADVLRKTNGKLAKDESVDTESVISALETILPMLADEDEKTETDPAAVDNEDDDEELITKLKAKGYTVSKAASDGDDEEAKKKAKEAEAALAAKDAEMKDMVKKPAMDAAIAAAVKIAADAATKTQRDIREAEKAVRPHVGELVAMDSADDVYRAALNVMKVDGASDLPAAALKPVFENVVSARANAAKPTPRIAQDAAAVKDYTTRFPDANRLKN